MVEAARGEGRTGLDGFVSESKVLINESASGTGATFALLAKVGVPALWRRILNIEYTNHENIRVFVAPKAREEHRRLSNIS